MRWSFLIASCMLLLYSLAFMYIGLLWALHVERKKTTTTTTYSSVMLYAIYQKKYMCVLFTKLVQFFMCHDSMNDHMSHSHATGHKRIRFFTRQNTLILEYVFFLVNKQKWRCRCCLYSLVGPVSCWSFPINSSKIANYMVVRTPTYGWFAIFIHGTIIVRVI